MLQIKKIKDDIEYYIEAASTDPDFEENTYIYDEINFQDEFADVVGAVGGTLPPNLIPYHISNTSPKKFESFKRIFSYTLARLSRKRRELMLLLSVKLLAVSLVISILVWLRANDVWRGTFSAFSKVAWHWQAKSVFDLKWVKVSLQY